MTDRTFKRPSLRFRSRHITRQLFNGWPWIVWIGAAVTVLLLLPGGMYRVRFHGVAERTYEYVSPLENGRLKSLSVELGDTVEPEQLLGELDSESLATELLMDQASLMKTRDKVHSIRYEVETLRLEEAKTAAEISALEASWKRNEDLLARKLILEQEVEDLRPQIAATKKILDRYPKLIEQLEKRLKLAEQDAQQFDSEELKQLQESQSKLISKNGGVVAEILHLPGDVVQSGDPVVRISNITTSRVIAFMPEDKTADISEGERCKVITSSTRQAHYGTVKTVTTDIRKLPVYTGFGDRILRGRRIVVQLDEGILLVPGERVVVVPDISVWDQWMGKK